ncbi:IS3 family transposase [Amycolatopsis sp. NPDC059657]|uniref:IS3 family transposase n=1 Tax=Amycolatopsis sp. NPDC059657 TaxID=3346899 RepID=UPI003671E071
MHLGETDIMVSRRDGVSVPADAAATSDDEAVRRALAEAFMADLNGLDATNARRVHFVDLQRGRYSVVLVCQSIELPLSTYYAVKKRQRAPSSRAERDRVLHEAIAEIWLESDKKYGVRKVWKELKSRDFIVARCTVERLMRNSGMRGSTRARYSAEDVES